MVRKSKTDPSAEKKIERATIAEGETRRMAQLEWFKNTLAHHENLSAAVVLFGQSLLRGSIILNGGAIIAVLSLYGALEKKPAVQGPLIMWAIALGLCAAAGYCAAKSQREFQVAAGHNFRRLAKQFFSLELPYQRVDAGDSKTAAAYGLELRRMVLGVMGEFDCVLCGRGVLGNL
jgi:hypothetical protein